MWCRQAIGNHYTTLSDSEIIEKLKLCDGCVVWTFSDFITRVKKKENIVPHIRMLSKPLHNICSLQMVSVKRNYNVELYQPLDSSNNASCDWSVTVNIKRCSAEINCNSWWKLYMFDRVVRINLIFYFIFHFFFFHFVNSIFNLEIWNIFTRKFIC